MKILCILLFLFVCLSQAEAYQSSQGFQINPPPRWEQANPKNGCGKNSLCFVPNPEQTEIIFVQAPSPSPANSSLKIQNLIAVLSFQDSSSKEELLRLKDKMIEGMKSVQQSGIIKDFRSENFKLRNFGKNQGLLLESRFQLGDYFFQLTQAFISGPQRTVLLSCSFSEEEAKHLQPACLKTLESIQFKN